MKKTNISIVDETLFYEKLDNGLEVYMIPNNNVKNVYATFTTKFGSMYDEFVPFNESKFIKVPLGIAHFLEHKLFETESGEAPFEYYTKSGTECNASTNFKSTSYEFFGPNNFINNICYLLDFVQNLYLTNELVEKEKGIIEQELNMYSDNPFWELYDGIRRNLLNSNGIKYPIGGTPKTIKEITKKNLEMCYNTFYHPSNMFLVITGNFDPEITINAIKENQSKKNFKNQYKIKLKDFKEIDRVAKDKEIIEKNTLIPKFSYGVKINTNKINMNITSMKKDLYLMVIFDILFGQTSKFFETVSEKKYLSNPMNIENIILDSHTLILLNGESLFSKELFLEIDNNLKNIKIEKFELDRIKKTLLSSNVKIFDNITGLNDSVIDNIIDFGYYDTNKLEMIKSLNIDEMNKIIKKLDFSNKSTFLVNPIQSKH